MSEKGSPKVVRGIAEAHSEQSLGSEPPSGREGRQSKGEFDLSDLAEAASELGVLSIKAEIGVEPPRRVKRAFRHDEVSALHHRSCSENEPHQAGDNERDAVKDRGGQLRRF